MLGNSQNILRNPSNTETQSHAFDFKKVGRYPSKAEQNGQQAFS